MTMDDAYDCGHTQRSDMIFNQRVWYFYGLIEFLLSLAVDRMKTITFYDL